MLTVSQDCWKDLHVFTKQVIRRYQRGRQISLSRKTDKTLANKTIERQTKDILHYTEN